jgi:hypothetical protein
LHKNIIMATIITGLLGLATLYTYHIITSKARERERLEAQAAVYRNHVSPVVIGQAYISQPLHELEQIAQMWREMLAASKNPFADKIPVYVYPYRAALTDAGSIALAWAIYEQQLAAERLIANRQWANNCPKEIRGLFLTQNIAPNPTEE